MTMSPIIDTLAPETGRGAGRPEIRKSGRMAGAGCKRRRIRLTCTGVHVPPRAVVARRERSCDATQRRDAVRLDAVDDRADVGGEPIGRSLILDAATATACVSSS